MNEETKKELKELGLTNLELITKESVEAVFKAIEIIVKDTENKIDDMVIPAIPFIKEKLLELVDKIA